jgi:hypothetical protein
VGDTRHGSLVVLDSVARTVTRADLTGPRNLPVTGYPQGKQAQGECQSQRRRVRGLEGLGAAKRTDSAAGPTSRATPNALACGCTALPMAETIAADHLVPALVEVVVTLHGLANRAKDLNLVAPSDPIAGHDVLTT